MNNRQNADHMPRAMHPDMGTRNSSAYKPKRTMCERERECLRRYCSMPMQGMRYLKVMVEECSTYLEMVNKNDRASMVSIPYKESHMVALITIHNGHAYIQDMTTSGHLVNYRPIPYNGSISRKDIMRAIDVYDNDFTRVYAQKVKSVRKK